jgi:hypothetical protein
MSYGMTVNGDDNRLLFSTNVNGMFFQGKATLFRIYPDPDTGTLVTTDYTTNQFTGEIIFSNPQAIIYEYRMTLPSSVTSIMPFIYNPVGKRVAILTIFKLSSTSWQIFTYACTNPNTTGYISSSTNVPEIYVFSDFLSSPSNVGYGINTFNSNGEVTFSTNSKPLIFNALYNANVRYSDLTYNATSVAWIGNGPGSGFHISYHDSLLPASSISKPAVFFAGNQTARGRNPNTGTVFVYEATARFLPSTRQLAIEWAQVARTFSLSNVNEQSTSPQFTAMVIDAAQYD